MYALDLATGATRLGWPVAVTTDPLDEHNYGGVNVFNGVAYAEIELSRLYRQAGKEAEAEAVFRDARRILNKAEAEEHRRERNV